MIEPLQEFLRLAEELRENRVDYALCGGVAMAVHGFVRATEDVDLLVESESLAVIRRIAAELGFRHTGPEIEFKSGTKLVRLLKSFPGTEDYLVLDLILVNANNRAAWDSRSELTVGSTVVKLVSTEGLKLMKRESNRGIDRTDIARLEGRDDEG